MVRAHVQIAETTSLCCFKSETFRTERERKMVGVEVLVTWMNPQTLKANATDMIQ